MALRSYLKGELFAEVFGETPPRVLALHGWARRGSDFKASLQGLPAIALDLPGFGASGAPKEAIGAAGYASIVAGMLAEFEQPPVVVGHSFGGRVALCLAEQHPTQVGPLVLTGVPMLRIRPAKTPPVSYRTVRWLHQKGIVSDQQMEKVRQKRGSADYRATSGVMREIFVTVVNEDYRTQLESVTQPISMIWGGKDTEVPVDVAETALAIRSDRDLPTDLTVIQDAGHMLPVTHPDQLRVVIEAAL